MITFKFKHIADAHYEIIRYLMWNHTIEHTENKELCFTGDPIAITITRPLDYKVHEGSPHRMRCEIYKKQILHGTTADFVYDYHNRLFEHDGNQISYCIRKITGSPTTRRAVAVTWRPSIDHEHDDVPCLQFVQFIRHESTLNMIVMFRSEDMLGGFGPNAYALVSLFEVFAKACDLKVGTYEHVVTVPHLYPKRDLPDIEKLLNVGMKYVYSQVND